MYSKFVCGTQYTGVDHTTLNSLTMIWVYKGFNVVKDHFLLQPKPFNFENFENRLVGQLRPLVPWVSGLPHPSNQQQPPTLKTLRTVSSEHNVGTKTPSHPTVLEGEH